jgi:hypothetical protein
MLKKTTDISMFTKKNYDVTMIKRREQIMEKKATQLKLPAQNIYLLTTRENKYRRKSCKP